MGIRLLRCGYCDGVTEYLHLVSSLINFNLNLTLDSVIRKLLSMAGKSGSVLISKMANIVREHPSLKKNLRHSQYMFKNVQSS